METVVDVGKPNELKIFRSNTSASITAIKIIITSLKVNTGTQKVIGITTSEYHNYVADGILTHNSCYFFAGGDSEAFNSIPVRFYPCKKFPLPIILTKRALKI